MSKLSIFFSVVIVCLLCACERGIPSNVTVPSEYDFNRNGSSTVDVTEPAMRISMSMALLDELYDYENSTLESIMDVWNNTNDPFDDPALNAYNGSIRSSIASSHDLFGGGNAVSEEVRKTMEDWIKIWALEVFPNTNQAAAPGVPGQIADWIDTRLVPGDGMEYLQVVSKSMNGALFMDQIVNHWLSTDILDAGNNRADNDDGVLVPGKNYTAMEFAWDQAYGYVYGLAPDLKNPMATIGSDDLFLNKYVKLIDKDDDFTGIAQDLFDAYLVGRAAIVSKNYKERDRQADIIKQKISDIMIIRTVFYLQSGINEYNKVPQEMGAYLHDTGEGNGFVYAMQFSKNPKTNEPFFSRAEALAFYADILDDGPNGLWSTKMSTLQQISEDIADRMDWTPVMAQDF
ncbi:MAG: DUF4856 domain-containing protein [Bacteroidota bacterium]